MRSLTRTNQETNDNHFRILCSTLVCQYDSRTTVARSTECSVGNVTRRRGYGDCISPQYPVMVHGGEKVGTKVFSHCIKCGEIPFDLTHLEDRHQYLAYTLGLQTLSEYRLLIRRRWRIPSKFPAMNWQSSLHRRRGVSLFSLRTHTFSELPW